MKIFFWGGGGELGDSVLRLTDIWRDICVIQSEMLALGSFLKIRLHIFQESMRAAYIEN